SESGLRYVPARNEQSMVHVATAYARQRNRLAAWACTSSVGPGATNMVTGAAVATVNRLPVLLLPGDTFASRAPHPVLQQIEAPHDAILTANDAFKPVSRFFDRITRPEQLLGALPEAMRVLTDPAETGAVTIALPEDVQTEAFDVPDAWLAERVWTVWRRPPAPGAVARTAALVAGARRPLIVAGGGAIYSGALGELRTLSSECGIPVCETQAGRGALLSDDPLALGAVGATGTAAANELAAEADVVIGVGTRWSDFTTASKSAFQDPGVRFVNVNVTSLDAHKHGGVAVEADAREALAALRAALGPWRAPADWTARAADRSRAWAAEVAELVSPGPADRPLRQAAVIGAVNDAAGATGVVVNAAGSMPGELHKLWRARDPAGKGYHVEYGFSCMGYEIPGAIGVKLAAPERDVWALVGDASWLIAPGELVTAVQERVPIRIVLVDNHGYASIGALSRSLGGDGFGTIHRTDGDEAAPPLPVDLAASVAALGVPVIRADTLDALRAALDELRGAAGPACVYVETDRRQGVPDHGWWDVPVAEVATQAAVRTARAAYERARERQRWYG
ncbi:MAG TPA: 3D-(3,5/4)-trihydroxycyclohexane-1,2-dione acylhydrolase (decyclizing), partial [Solirubrobacter sp.]|nr:3D-(3,5/4)-trihydroxycyclohexane-1,2-dione acylhydrolase (decyclizing) [Solirubrobacter sp.]